MKAQLKYKVDKVFVNEFLRYLSIRDFDSIHEEDLVTYVQYSYSYVKQLATKEKEEIMEDFKTKDFRKRKDMLKCNSK